MKFTQAQSLEYKAQVPSFIRRMKGERVESDAEHPSEEQGEEEVDEFGRSRQKRTEHLEREEKEDEDDEIKAMIKDGAQIDNLEILKEKPEKTDATPPPVDSPTQNDSPKKEAAQQGVAFGKASKKRKTLRVDNTSSTPSSSLPSSAPKKKKVKQNKGLSSHANERILLDLQGSIEVEMGVDKVDVGNLDISNENSPVLFIGHHRIQGKVHKLQKPLAILQKQDSNYYVKNIIYKTFLFTSRPSY